MKNMNEQLLDAVIKHHQDMMAFEIAQFQIQLGIVNAISGIVDAIDTKCIAYFGNNLTVTEVVPYQYVLKCVLRDGDFTDGKNINGYKMWATLFINVDDIVKNDDRDYRDIVFKFHLEQTYFNDDIGVDEWDMEFGDIDTWELSYSPDVDTEPEINYHITDKEIYSDPMSQKPEADFEYYKKFQAFINSFKEKQD